jgi:hypothetical protein
VSTYCFVAKSRAATGFWVTVTEVRPAGVKDVPPSAMFVVPNVIELFVRLELPILVRVFADPLIDTPANVVRVPPKLMVSDPNVIVLFVRLALPILLSVFVEPLIDLFVSVWLPVRVATVESIAMVIGVEPSKLVPVRPVPMVRAAVVLAVIVPDAPRATLTPLYVTELLSSDAFGIAVNVFKAPDIDLPDNVAGMSALTRSLNDVGAGAPDVGPA